MKTSIALSLLAAGLLAAQPRLGPRRDFESRLAQNLGLSAEQQNKIHGILAESRLNQPDREQMRSLQASLTDAIKAGDEVKIDQITQQMGTFHQQQQAVHAKTIAKIYATLTPDQKTKAGQNLEMLMGGPGGRGPRPARVPQ